MSEIFEVKENVLAEAETEEKKEVLDVVDDFLVSVDADLANYETTSMPIASLASFGAAISSMMPAFNTITETTTMNTEGLYKLANKTVSDTLKKAKDGTSWGAFKTAEGKSKMVKLKAVDGVDVSTVTKVPINPAVMMMAVAIYQLDQKLDKIEETQKQIFDFLKFEKESKIEANIQTLSDILKKYKMNWDNELFVSGHHSETITIKRDALENMKFYPKQIKTLLGEKKNLVSQKDVEKLFEDLEEQFRFYRMSLYTYSLASMIEVMLNGNFGEAYIAEVKDDIERLSLEYRDYFEKASAYIEKLSNGAIDTKLVKGIGNIGQNVGKFIGGIPVLEKGPIDEALQKGGAHLTGKAEDAKEKAVYAFASLGDPQTALITDRLQDMIRIYNHTESICFDNERIYLIDEAI